MCVVACIVLVLLVSVIASAIARRASPATFTNVMPPISLEMSTKYMAATAASRPLICSCAQIATPTIQLVPSKTLGRQDISFTGCTCKLTSCPVDVMHVLFIDQLQRALGSSDPCLSLFCSTSCISSLLESILVQLRWTASRILQRTTFVGVAVDALQ